jgi:cytochrome P450
VAAPATSDPFDDFDRAMGAGTVRDPYPQFAEMRSQGPIIPIDFQQMLEQMQQGEQNTNNIVPPDSLEVFAAVSHDAVSEVLRDGKTFSSSGYAASMGLVMGRTILQMDEPEHGRYRGVIQQAFTRKALDRWEHELVTPVVNELIDAFAPTGRAELIRGLTFPFPVRVIIGMLGLPPQDYPEFHRLAVELISIGIDFERSMAASQKLADYFRPILARRREAPEEDLMSVLAHAELEGTRLTDDEIFAFLRLLLPAGAETTYRSSSNLIFGLLSNPDQLDALRENRSLMDRAIDEGLRWEAPLTGIMRLCMSDTEVCGVKIPSGAVVQVNLGAANHDETRYERPDAFDIHREARQHMAFAFGPHRCLGMHLARMETRVVVNSLIDRLPNLRLDPEADDVHITGAGFRAPRALPIVFDS